MLVAAGIASTGSNDYFDWPVPFLNDFNFRDFWCYLGAVGGVLNCSWNMYSMKRHASVLEIFKKTFMGMMVNASFIMASLFRGKNPELFEGNYIFFLVAYVLVFARLSKAMMVNHCCNQNYSMIQLPA